MARDYSINTIIGPGTCIEGDLNAGGFTRVDGNVRGNLSARGRVVIGEGARLKSSVSGTTVVVGGVVAGNITATERLVVLSSGIVLGNVVTRRIQADEGCLIHGRVKVCAAEVSRAPSG
ncbi:MAG: polymer-forming cytoskeletal protein [Treponema sp.]|jgi:cytoskeletal protein CcmA (bactofilin family)|nr:polymer-forming cytoskeletal protein [Treponema sp.]